MSATVEEYLTTFDPRVRALLESVRATIYSAVPDAVESISYGIPAYSIDGQPFIYFGGWSKHISVYPLPVDDAEDPMIEVALAPFVAGRGTAKFPLSAPIPLDLITRMAKRLRAQRIAD